MAGEHSTGSCEQQRDIDFDKIKEGTRVEYKPVGTAMQTTHGIIKKILTHDDTVGSNLKHIRADDEHPRFLIENEVRPLLGSYLLSEF